LLLAGCAGRQQLPAPDDTATGIEAPAGERPGSGTPGAAPPESAATGIERPGDTPPPPVADVEGIPDAADAGELEDEGDPPPLLDRTQQTVYTVVNSTSNWFDGFFGSAALDTAADEDAQVTRGLLALGLRYDEVDELDSTVRFRARFPLRALKRRTRLLLGRGDTDDLVDGTETETLNTLPDQFSDFADDDWLLGLGYRQRSGLKNGFDFGIGASIRSSGLDPYVRATYRWNGFYGDDVFWRLRPRVYWQEQRGEGASLTSIFDYVVNPRWLLRSWTTLKSDKEVLGMGWRAELLAYQSIDDDTAFAYRAFGIGETNKPVELQDYGVELRYRRRILRRWLFLELSAGVSWPREFIEETRESNIGVGVELEMQFGDWPGRKQIVPVPDD
jgi:hypothetical protein